MTGFKHQNAPQSENLQTIPGSRGRGMPKHGVRAVKAPDKVAENPGCAGVKGHRPLLPPGGAQAKGPIGEPSFMA